MNSSIEISEAAKLAQKLIDRTSEGRVHWSTIEMVGTLQHAMSKEPAIYEDRFDTRLEPNLRASVCQIGSDYLEFSLIETSEGNGAPSVFTNLPKETVVIDVHVEKNPPYGYDSQQEKYLAALLIDLYGLARRSALKMDASVEKALGYLDRIAG